MKIYVSYSKGSNSGSAVYLGYEDEAGGAGYRLAGPKCWGYIDSIEKWYLDEYDLNRLIQEVKFLKKAFKAQDKKLEKEFDKLLKDELSHK